MLKLTDTDGDPHLFSKHYMLRVQRFMVPRGVNETTFRAKFAIQPKSVVIDVAGNSVAVLETVEDIYDKLRGFEGDYDG